MSDTPTPETDAFINRMFHDREHELTELYNFTMGLERELKAALATNAELLERLQEARESHLIATARKVQTIQQQAVEIDRLKSVLADIYSLSRS
jgi:hypothetical protein